MLTTDTPPDDPPLSELLTKRHQSVRAAGRWLLVNPALPEHLARVSGRFADLAAALLYAIPVDDPELTRALTLLCQAKDSAVRAAIVAAESGPGLTQMPVTESELERMRANVARSVPMREADR